MTASFGHCRNDEIANFAREFGQLRAVEIA
jgi:hypothetical protein